MEPWNPLMNVLQYSGIFTLVASQPFFTGPICRTTFWQLTSIRNAKPGHFGTSPTKVYLAVSSPSPASNVLLLTSPVSMRFLKL